MLLFTSKPIPPREPEFWSKFRNITEDGPIMTENKPKKYFSVQVQSDLFSFRFMFSLDFFFRSNFKNSCFLVFRSLFFRFKDRTPTEGDPYLIEARLMTMAAVASRTERRGGAPHN